MPKIVLRIRKLINMKNKKGLLIAAASVASVGLLGVGFASWIITGQTSVTTGNVTVNVGDAQDYRITTTLVDFALIDLSDDTGATTSGDKSSTSLGLNFDFIADSTLTLGKTTISGNGTSGDYRAVKVTYTVAFSNQNNNANLYDQLDKVTATLNISGGSQTVTWASENVAVSNASDSLIIAPITPEATVDILSNTDIGSDNVAAIQSSAITSDFDTVKDTGDNVTLYETSITALTAKSVTATTIFYFNWGSAFNYQSPTEYLKAFYSSSSSEEVVKAEVTNVYNDLVAAADLEAFTFTFDIDPVLKTTTSTGDNE